MQEVNDSSFETEVLKAEKPVLVEFWAPWCGPCRSMAPLLEEVAGQMTWLKVVKVNVDESPDWATKYRVRGIPNMMMFNKGKMLAQEIGAIPKEKLIEFIEKA